MSALASPPRSWIERLQSAPAAMALPVGILALLVLMVLPIPSLLLDIFFVLNNNHGISKVTQSFQNTYQL